MEELLTPVSTRLATESLVESERRLATPEKSRPSISQSTTPRETLEILRAKPDRKELSQILVLLTSSKGNGLLPIHDSTSITAQIINVLVNNTIPDFWQGFISPKDKKGRLEKDSRKLLQCLTSVTGLGAVLARMRNLWLVSEDEKPTVPSSNVVQLLTELLDVLSLTLMHPDFLSSMFSNLPDPSQASARYTALLRETVSLICSSKLLSTTSEAASILQKRSKTFNHDYWIASGEQYAQWLGNRISTYSLEIDDTKQKTFNALTQMLGKSLSLGYTGMSSMIIDKSTKRGRSNCEDILRETPPSEFRTVLDKISFRLRQAPNT
jgi:telomere length regulation protein